MVNDFRDFLEQNNLSSLCLVSNDINTTFFSLFADSPGTVSANDEAKYAAAAFIPRSATLSAVDLP